jgi:hypothetical protein
VSTALDFALRVTKDITDTGIIKRDDAAAIQALALLAMAAEVNTLTEMVGRVGLLLAARQPRGEKGE